MDDLERRRQNQATYVSAGMLAQILEHALPKHVLKSFELLTGGASNLNSVLRFDGTPAPAVLRVYTRRSIGLPERD